MKKGGYGDVTKISSKLLFKHIFCLINLSHFMFLIPVPEGTCTAVFVAELPSHLDTPISQSVEISYAAGPSITKAICQPDHRAGRLSGPFGGALGLNESSTNDLAPPCTTFHMKTVRQGLNSLPRPHEDWDLCRKKDQDLCTTHLKARHALALLWSPLKISKQKEGR